MNDESVVTAMLDKAARHWNPDDFSELVELLKSKYPTTVERWDADNCR